MNPVITFNEAVSLASKLRSSGWEARDIAEISTEFGLSPLDAERVEWGLKELERNERATERMEELANDLFRNVGALATVFRGCGWTADDEFLIQRVWMKNARDIVAALCDTIKEMDDGTADGGE